MYTVIVKSLIFICLHFLILVLRDNTMQSLLWTEVRSELMGLQYIHCKVFLVVILHRHL